jgi:hypothetical protein
MTAHDTELLDILTIEAYHNTMMFENQVEKYHDYLLDRLEGNNSIRQLHDHQRLNIACLDDETSIKLFYFTLSETKRIATAFGLPESIEFKGDISLNSTEALAIMLRRLIYTTPELKDLELLFGLDGSTITTVFDFMMEKLYTMFHQGIRYNKNHLHSFNSKRFSSAITVKKGCCDKQIVGFIDVSLDPIQRSATVMYTNQTNKQNTI